VDETGLLVELKKEDLGVNGEVFELNCCVCTLGDVVLTIWIGWMILKFPGVEDIMMGSTWNTPLSLGVIVNDLGITVGEDFTADKLINGVVAGVVSLMTSSNNTLWDPAILLSWVSISAELVITFPPSLGPGTVWKFPGLKEGCLASGMENLSGNFKLLEGT